VLAAVLPRLELQPGVLFRFAEEEQAAPELQLLNEANAVQRGVIVLRGIVAVIVIIYPIYIIISMLSKEGRRRLFRDLSRLAVLILFLVWFSDQGAEFMKGLQPGEELLLGQPVEFTPQATLVAFEPTPGDTAAKTILIMMALGLAASTAAFAWWWFQPSHRKVYPTPTPHEQLAEQAGQAVKAIESGEQLSNVILRCYYQMERILDEGRGLQRPQQDTPAEFATALIDQGLPEMPVRQLTRLFEAARYGSLEMNAESQQSAVKCLTAIQRSVAFGL